MKLQTSRTIIWLTFVSSVCAFVPTPGRTNAPLRRETTSLYAADETATKESEKNLRQELAEKTSKVEDEGQYAVVDGMVEQELTPEVEVPTTTVSSSSSSSQSSDLKARIERLTKPRVYPLFLVEKGLEIVEGAFDDFRKSLASTGAAQSKPRTGKKERVVILGTGWGAAAFLKDIDTSLYDVTVVSPRVSITLYHPVNAFTLISRRQERVLISTTTFSPLSPGYLFMSFFHVSTNRTILYLHLCSLVLVWVPSNIVASPSQSVR